MIRTFRIWEICLLAAVVCCFSGASASAQTLTGNSAIRSNVAVNLSGPTAVSILPDVEKAREIVPPTMENSNAAVHPSTVYRIGRGDILKIGLKGPTLNVRYLKVDMNGCIDFQLAGDSVCVAGSTAAEASEMLRRSIKLFADPNVVVEVREFASHTITVAGLVEQPGQQQIQRDAVPFYVVRAGVVLSSPARSVRVTRNASERSEVFDLSNPNLGEIYIFPGDTVEFL